MTIIDHSDTDTTTTSDGSASATAAPIAAPDPARNVELIATLPANFPHDVEAVRDRFADDFVWTYVNPRVVELEGEYDGVDGLQDFFDRLGRLTGGTFGVRIQDIHAVGVELVMVHAIPSMTIDGFSFETDAAVVWRVVDGKIAAAWDIPGVFHAIRPVPAERDR